ncbi:anti-anti-sigma factor [Mycobacteriaceae bacterium 1482268.1]|nr:anti-anti-sigma factor [Mycobacteriaceae bacterium 1482268.1]
MPTPLNITTYRRDDGTFVLTAAGEVDLSNIDAFSAALDDGWAHVGRDGARLTVDLTDVEYLDSCAINALFGHAEGMRLIANPMLIPVLTISGLTDVAVVEPAS